MKLNIQNSNLKMTAGDKKQFPKDNLPQIVFVGRSNVGKSSLINTLLGRKSLARVSSSPGKTITVNFYDIDHKLYLVDLPGYGFAKRTPEERNKLSRLTDGYFTDNERADMIKCVLQLVDMRVGFTKDDRVMLDYLASFDIPYALILTKSDKLNKTEYTKALETISSDDFAANAVAVIPFSSASGLGKPELWDTIIKFC